jgi:hypothetical protein
MQAEAPIIAGQYNQDVQNQQAAPGNLFSAGQGTYGLLNANQGQANQNFGNGVASIGAGVSANTAAPSAALQAASQQWGIPVAQMTQLLSAISPVAAQFGTQSGTTTGTQTMSGAQQFGLWGQGLNQMSQGVGNAGARLFGA